MDGQVRRSAEILADMQAVKIGESISGQEILAAMRRMAELQAELADFIWRDYQHIYYTGKRL